MQPGGGNQARSDSQRATRALIEYPPRHSVTPPSTPTSAAHLSTRADLLAIPSMFELTRHKLERAAQAQLSGRRGAGGLRELVLLSNMFGSTLSSSSDQQGDSSGQTPPYETEPAWELDEQQQRRQDEERWLDGVLEEMLEADEDGSEAEAYVSVTIRNGTASSPGDSGFLEAIAKNDFVRVGELEQILEEVDICDEAPIPIVHDSTMLPSPPIALPEYRAPLVPAIMDNLSESPPLHPPSLTPDHSPPGLGPAREMLSTSIESIDSWITDLSTQRLGLAALDLSSCSSNPVHPFKPDSEYVRDLTLSISPSSLDLAVRRSSWWPDALAHRPMPLVNFKSCLDCIDFGHAPLATADSPDAGSDREHALKKSSPVVSRGQTGHVAVSIAVAGRKVK
ncbi:hypothetical protein OIV83_001326 [Microbotryomycetes sp. JL201]|nr:hypothetical protein OIV83_001326 [Microbotryomycetes sp. JL201]